MNETAFKCFDRLCAGGACVGQFWLVCAPPDSTNARKLAESGSCRGVRVAAGCALAKRGARRAKRAPGAKDLVLVTPCTSKVVFVSGWGVPDAHHDQGMQL